MATPEHVRLFLPGPIEVHPDILAEMARPMIGHRQEAYRVLHREVRAGLQWLFETKNDVIVSTSSATGCWEAAARNGVKKGILHLLNGNFSERWEETSRLCGKKTGKYELDWGKAISTAVADLDDGMTRNLPPRAVWDNLRASVAPVADQLRAYTSVDQLAAELETLAGAPALGAHADAIRSVARRAAGPGRAWAEQFLEVVRGGGGKA